MKNMNTKQIDIQNVYTSQKDEKGENKEKKPYVKSAKQWDDLPQEKKKVVEEKAYDSDGFEIVKDKKESSKKAYIGNEFNDKHEQRERKPFNKNSENRGNKYAETGKQTEKVKTEKKPAEKVSTLSVVITLFKI